MYVSSYECVVDDYDEKASIALASVTIMRYLIAVGMVMAARSIYENIWVHDNDAVEVCGGAVDVGAVCVVQVWEEVKGEGSV